MLWGEGQNGGKSRQSNSSRTTWATEKEERKALEGPESSLQIPGRSTHARTACLYIGEQELSSSRCFTRSPRPLPAASLAHLAPFPLLHSLTSHIPWHQARAREIITEEVDTKGKRTHRPREGKQAGRGFFILSGRALVIRTTQEQNGLIIRTVRSSGRHT